MTASPAQYSLAKDAIVDKATLRAARLLRLSNRELASVLGVSESSLSRAAKGTRPLSTDAKKQELMVLFIRFYRALDAIVGGDDAASAAWMRADNSALKATPIDAIKSIAGLTGALAYLDARRAVI